MPNYHERSGNFEYLRFNIASWPRHINLADPEASLLRFVRPLFEFIDGALQRGEMCLVHCLAGAHRAGTTGCLLLMYKHQLDPSAATSIAKKLRPVINPIGHLPEFLTRYDLACSSYKNLSPPSSPKKSAQHGDAQAEEQQSSPREVLDLKARVYKSIERSPIHEPNPRDASSSRTRARDREVLRNARKPAALGGLLVPSLALNIGKL